MNYLFREKKDSANMNNAFNPVTKLKNLLVDLFDIDIIIILLLPSTMHGCLPTIIVLPNFCLKKY